MEKQTKNIYYIGIETQKESCPKKKAGKSLAVYKHTKPFDFKNGSVRLYFSLLPASFCQEVKKKRLRKRWFDRLERSLACVKEAADTGGSCEILFAESICQALERKQEIPEELYKVRLKEIKSRRSFVHINISLPDECGPSMAEGMIELLEPYLPSINFVTFVGAETRNSWLIEDYLYEEYGIVMSYGKRPEKNALWIDYAEKGSTLLTNYARENGIYCLNGGEVLNFLDTTVKNGYNTKVN